MKINDLSAEEQKTLHELIDASHSEIEFGTIHITLKKDHGLVSSVDTNKIASRRVSGAAQALTLIGSMLKLLGEAQETGNLTFTIGLKKGEATELLTQDFQRDILDKETGKYR